MLAIGMFRLPLQLDDISEGGVLSPLSQILEPANSISFNSSLTAGQSRKSATILTFCELLFITSTLTS